MAKLSLRIKKKFAKTFLGMHRARRYENLVRIVDELGARRILEIGVFNGKNGARMLRAAAQHHPAGELEYYGFDLFEALDAAWQAAEISKRPPTQAEVQATLDATGARVRLIAGDTTLTLPREVPQLPVMDVIVIDGGHSLATIASDWAAIQPIIGPRTAVIFDDYWNRTDSGAKPLIDGLDRGRYTVEHLPPIDRFVREWGTHEISMVRVGLKA